MYCTYYVCTCKNTALLLTSIVNTVNCHRVSSVYLFSPLERKNGTCMVSKTSKPLPAPGFTLEPVTSAIALFTAWSS